jgi:hypothetical protein
LYVPASQAVQLFSPRTSGAKKNPGWHRQSARAVAPGVGDCESGWHCAHELFSSSPLKNARRHSPQASEAFSKPGRQRQCSALLALE